MKKTLLTLFAAGMVTLAGAQCTFPVLAGSIQITSNTTITTAGASY